MLDTKTNTAQQIIEKISPTATKVNFISNETLAHALLQLENKGFPTSKHEDYKYCNLSAILHKEFKNIEQNFVEIEAVSDYKMPNAINLVVINGNYSEKLSDTDNIKGLRVCRLSKLNQKGSQLISTIAKVQSDSFIAFNTAYSADGFFLEIEDKALIQAPIHIIYISSSSSQAFVNTRNLICANENSEATIIERQLLLGEQKIFTNYLSEKVIQSNARLNCFTIQNEGMSGFSLNTNQVEVAMGANYSNTTITLSGQLVRNNHNVALVGRNCEANLNGLFYAKGSQLIDNHTLIDHQVPDCQSNELYKGIANDKSIGVFNGKIFVKKDAQKTNAYQSSKNILLSNDATINAKPQLEIYANDVKCSHGTSTGKLDENALFYLNSRGISKESARKILLSSFAGEVIDKITAESLQEEITTLFEEIA